MRWLVVLACASCVQAAPQATLVVHEQRQPTSHAVLVMPTACVSQGGAWLCTPSVYDGDNKIRQLSDNFATYIDPPLRLKLEFAGFTLAEAGAMRLVTADRVDVNGSSAQIEDPEAGPQTVGELTLEQARGVASSLALSSVLIPRLLVVPHKHGMQMATLEVTLLAIDTLQPRWSVTCSEILYDAMATPNRLANCVGNGVLAVLAPDNVIGKVLE